MALGDTESIVPGNRAEQRDPGGREGLPECLDVAGPPSRVARPPAMFGCGSNAENPRAVAAALRAEPPTSITRMTGVPSNRATSAVDPSSPAPARPS